MAKINGELERAQLENLSSDPSSGTRGRIWYNTTDNVFRFDDGTLIRNVMSLNNNEYLVGRNSAGDGNVNLIKVNASGLIEFGVNINGLTLGNIAPSQDGELSFNTASDEYEGFSNSQVVSLGKTTDMRIQSNDAVEDGTVILRDGKRWINGIEEFNTSSITSAAPSIGTDDLIRTLDGSTGLRSETTGDIRNHIYWDTISDEFVTISNDATAADDTNKYDNPDRNINTTRYAPIGYVDVVQDTAGDHTLTVYNYPIESWDSFHQLLAADGWQDFTPAPTSPTSTWTAVVDWARFRRVGNSVEFSIKALATSSGSSDAYFEFTAPIVRKDLGIAEQSFGGGFVAQGTATLIGSFAQFSDANTIRVFKGDNTVITVGTDRGFNIHGEYEINAADGFNPLATQATEFNSNTAALTFKATAIVDADPVGTFNVYKFDSSDVRTISTTAPSQSVSGMNTDGIKLFSRLFGVASTSGEPVQIGIKIGSNIDPRSVELFGYQNVGKSTTLDISITTSINSNLQFGVLTGYDRASGILWLSVDSTFSGVVGRRIGARPETGNTALDGYVEIFASAITPLVGLPAGRRVEKLLTGDKTTDGTMTDITVTGLVVGKTYQVNTSMALFTDSSSQNPDCRVTHDGNTIDFLEIQPLGGDSGGEYNIASTIIFVATVTTLTFVAGGISASNSKVSGNNTKEETWVEVIELPYQVPTVTDF